MAHFTDIPGLAALSHQRFSRAAVWHFCFSQLTLVICRKSLFTNTIRSLRRRLRPNYFILPFLWEVLIHCSTQRYGQRRLPADTRTLQVWMRLADSHTRAPSCTGSVPVSYLPRPIWREFFKAPVLSRLRRPMPALERRYRRAARCPGGGGYEPPKIQVCEVMTPSENPVIGLSVIGSTPTMVQRRLIIRWFWAVTGEHRRLRDLPTGMGCKVSAHSSSSGLQGSCSSVCGYACISAVTLRLLGGALWLSRVPIISSSLR